MKVTFSTEQKIAIELGRKERRRLIKECKRIANRLGNVEFLEYIDSLIAGDSGVGKTYNITRMLDELGIRYEKFSGNASIFGLMGRLMLLHAHKPAGEKMVVFLDDCDFLFQPENLNILKLMTSTQKTDRCFEYTKKISPKSFTEGVQQVLDQYLLDGGDTPGLVIPCDEFIFVIASNKVLANDQTIKDMTRSQKAKAEHELAIRGRFRMYDFELNKESKWGWLYDVAINDNGLYMLEDEDQKLYLLDWVWQNWDRMKETSVRTIQKMGFEIVEDSEEYKDNWELDYLVKH